MRIEELRQASEDDPGLIQRLAEEQGVTCAEFLRQVAGPGRYRSPVVLIPVEVAIALAFGMMEDPRA